jgi:hypothetical protein
MFFMIIWYMLAVCTLIGFCEDFQQFCMYFCDVMKCGICLQKFWCSIQNDPQQYLAPTYKTIWCHIPVDHTAEVSDLTQF